MIKLFAPERSSLVKTLKEETTSLLFPKKDNLNQVDFESHFVSCRC